jgi:hypothetical protein
MQALSMRQDPATRGRTRQQDLSRHSKGRNTHDAINP